VQARRRAFSRRALPGILLACAVALFAGAGLVSLRQHQVAAHSGFSEPVELSSDGGVLRATISAAAQEVEIAGQPFRGMLYNGSLVGPTVHLRPGDRLELTLLNALGEPTNLHFHGLHVSPEGESDNIFREVPAGATARYVVDIPADHAPGTFWYHSHQHHLSYEQVLGGLSGLIVIDGLTALLPAELRGIEERVLALKDFEVSSDPMTPSVRTVNGLLDPELSLAPGETQLWRLANIGPELFYHLALPGYAFHVIGEDGSPVWRTWQAETLLLPPGKRYDVLVQGGNPGAVPLKMLSYEQGCVACPEITLATVTVAGAAVPAANLPASLVAPNRLTARDVDQRRTLVFSSDDEDGQYFINGQLFDAERVDAVARLGDVEEWTLQNNDEDEHPFHIHINDFEVVSVNGQPYDAPGRQDTVVIPGHGAVVIRIPFADFAGRFVYHCHILFHGDGGMMGVVDVVN
jgi:FtsP/CotA-like multicopper oxidase with cupredoxin domain